MSRAGVGASAYYILSFRCLSFGCGLNGRRLRARIMANCGRERSGSDVGGCRDRRLHADRVSAAAQTSARSAPVGGRLFVSGMSVLRSAGKKFLPAILFPYLWHGIPTGSVLLLLGAPCRFFVAGPVLDAKPHRPPPCRTGPFPGGPRTENRMVRLRNDRVIVCVGCANRCLRCRRPARDSLSPNAGEAGRRMIR